MNGQCNISTSKPIRRHHTTRGGLMLHNALHNIVQYYSHCSYRSIVPLCRHSQKTHNRHWTHTHRQAQKENQRHTQAEQTGKRHTQPEQTGRRHTQAEQTGRRHRETDQPKRDTQGHTRHTKMDFKPNPKYIQKF